MWETVNCASKYVGLFFFCGGRGDLQKKLPLPNHHPTPLRPPLFISTPLRLPSKPLLHAFSQPLRCLVQTPHRPPASPPPLGDASAKARACMGATVGFLVQGVQARAAQRLNTGKDGVSEQAERATAECGWERASV